MQKIRIDFDNPGLPQHISAVENDSQSRFFQATLYENGKAYTAPEGATYSIMYRGFGPQNQGWYDTINDGAGNRAACAVSGNVVTCEIARQVLQVPGHVSIVLCVTTGKGYMIKSWPIECDCKNDRYDSTVEIQGFFYVTQVSNADWNRILQALEDLKNTIDPTLSVSGKAADAAKVGEAINAEAERAKGVEGQLKEDLDLSLKSSVLDVDFSIDGYLNALGNEGKGNGKITDWIYAVGFDKVKFENLLGNNESYDGQESSKVGIVCFYGYEKRLISSASEYEGYASDTVDIPAGTIWVRLCRWYTASDGKAWIYSEANHMQKPISEIENLNYCLCESINKPFSFSGKVVHAFGDSITAGVTSPGLQQKKPYIEYFAEKVGASKTMNWAVSGSTFSHLTEYGENVNNSIYSKFIALNKSDLTGVKIFAGGTNDWNRSVQLGTFGTTDSRTVYGSVWDLCQYIKNNFDDCDDVIFITPIPYTKAYYEANKNMFKNKLNSLGRTLKDYGRAIYEVATYHGFTVVNGYTLGMPTGNGEWDNKMCDNTDGCHPTEDGHKLYARSLAGKLL